MDCLQAPAGRIGTSEWDAVNCWIARNPTLQLGLCFAAPHVCNACAEEHRKVLPVASGEGGLGENPGSQVSLNSN